MEINKCGDGDNGNIPGFQPGDESSTLSHRSRPNSILDEQEPATPDEVRALNKSLKKHIKSRVTLERWNYNNDTAAMEAYNMPDFKPEPYFELYQENLPWKEFVNYATSTVYRDRVGRSMKFLIKDRRYGFTYGIVQVANLAMSKALRVYLEKKLNEPLSKKSPTFNFTWINDHIVDMSVCVGLTPLTYLLTGKMMVYMVMSKDFADIWNFKYGKTSDIKYVMTTSLYGRSSQYNRIKEFPCIGYTTGFNSLFTDDQLRWLKLESHKRFPDWSATADAHSFRMYTSLQKYIEKEGKAMPFNLVRTPRTAYFYDSDIFPHKSLKDNIDFWLKRWYYPRVERIKAGEIKPLPEKKTYFENR